MIAYIKYKQSFNMTIIEIYSHMNFNFLSQNNFIYMIVL